jgi:hypothetical protein
MQDLQANSMDGWNLLSLPFSQKLLFVVSTDSTGKEL